MLFYQAPSLYLGSLVKKKHFFMVASPGPYPIDQTKLNNTPSVPSLDCLFFFLPFSFTLRLTHLDVIKFSF